MSEEQQGGFSESHEISTKKMTKIVFKINGRKYEADGKYSPDFSLNEYIRNVADLRGTKSMCHEGGCGACVVTVKASLPPINEVKTFAVNSCLVSVLSCHGWEVTTVEGIGNRTIGYHDIQKRLAEFNGTQCGYCTPGWIMNMYSLYTSKKKQMSTTEIENSFASNICRCTGYRSIADAFKSFATDTNEKLTDKIIDIEELGMLKLCKKINKDDLKETDNVEDKDGKESMNDDWCIVDKPKEMMVIDCKPYKWYKVFSLDDVFKAIKLCDTYIFIAGNTGQGIYHMEDYPPNIIDIFNVVELRGYILDVNLILGAGMTLTEMMEVFQRFSAENEDFYYLKQFYLHMDLVAHIPVRNIGTIGGNLYLKYAHNDFQSDLFLLFETVGAMITIANDVHKTKTMSLTKFLEIDMHGKIIINVMLPPLSNCCSVKTYKIMPRSQNAHAVVNAGFLFKFKHNSTKLEKATLIYGSISPKFIHAFKTEAKLINKDPFTEQALQTVLQTLSEEIVPEEGPPEPSAKYRKMLALALYYKAILSLCPDDKLNKRYRSGGETIKRQTSKGSQTFDTDKNIWPLNQPIPKLEALVQCSGEATFANDLPSQVDEVFGAFVCGDEKPGSLISHFDVTEAEKVPGFIAFYTVHDLPGENNFMPLTVPLLVEKEEILCSKEIKFNGQPVGIVVANRYITAHKAAMLVKVHYASKSTNVPLLTITDVLDSPVKDKRINHDKTIEATSIGNNVKSVLYGELKLGSQYHYYMEPQTCVVKPTENGFEVYSSTQWMDLTSIAVAQCLNLPINSVDVIVRRVGGSYGGKITRSPQIACAAAIVSYLQGKPCRFILPLQTNMKIIGMRASTYCNYEVGVDNNGEIQYLKIKYYQDNGTFKNDTISSITLMHFINCYDSSRWHMEAYSVITDKPSTTWCRAPASTEGVAMVEYIMERIADKLGKDDIEVRLINMKKENNPIPELLEQLKKDSNYDDRIAEVKKFNKENRWRKRALKLMPMTYDLFYIGPYNAIVSIFYADGTVSVTHGAIEMGQGVNTKVAQVCAYTLGIPLHKVSVKPSTSFTSPNCMTTGASVGSECASFATMKACEQLLTRLDPIKNLMKNPTWEELVKEAFNNNVDLQASYMYSSKDPLKSYDIYGVVGLEVEVDILTGNHDVRRVDLLEDTGRSLSPHIDVAQIEGAFVMGLGYWTSEHLILDPATGKLLTDRTWNYKPPGIKDIPSDFRVYFRRNASNESGVLQSKATGEPAFCLTSVLSHAIREAVRAARLEAGYEDQWVEIGHPYTVENIFMAVGHKLEHFTLK